MVIQNWFRRRLGLVCNLCRVYLGSFNVLKVCLIMISGCYLGLVQVCVGFMNISITAGFGLFSVGLNSFWVGLGVSFWHLQHFGAWVSQSHGVCGCLRHVGLRLMYSLVRVGLLFV